jgi:beta-galactosidase/beta-glucuronidase
MVNGMGIASREFLLEPDALNMAGTPRSEYPRPQFVRSEWLCLNGEWEFEIDRDDDGAERGLLTRPLAQTIVVPFSPESELSGIGISDFLEAVWYRRTVSIPAGWAGDSVLLRFQASDHDTTVWVNGAEVGRHRGGFTPFAFDITDALTVTDPVIVVRVRDHSSAVQARGKQSTRPENYEAFYSRTTGIWQTVWLEPVSRTHLGRARITPNSARDSFRFEVPIVNPTKDTAVEIVISDDEGEVARASARADGAFQAEATVVLPLTRRRVWSPEDPHLYGIRFVLRDGERVVDRVESYAGLRSVSIDGSRVLLNGEPRFQRLVLDQGWYEDGHMTAPTDSALSRDIELGLSAGFNGARLHQKVFEERYLFHADRLGYLVWGEFPDWGARVSGRQSPNASFVAQWIEAVNRDYSHPSIVGWCPLNETFETVTDQITTLDDVTQAMYAATKALDQTRPVLDASGYSHRVVGADIYDSHNYEQDPEIFAAQMSGLDQGDPFVNTAPDGAKWSIPYAGQPYFCSEFGGIWWSATESASTGSWGYGAAPTSVEAWYARAGALIDVLLSDPKMFGYCFTQLTDVFQEKNGIFTFQRAPKFDLERIRAMQNRPAAIEVGPTHHDDPRRDGPQKKHQSKVRS